MAAPYAIRAYEGWLVRTKHGWRGTAAIAVVGPLLYLVAMGGGLGSLISGHEPPSLGGVRYGDFVAPGLMAAAAMQAAVGEASWPVHGAARWDRIYYAMLAAPLRVRDVFHGHLLFMLTRIALGSMSFALCAALLGFRIGWLGLLAVPAAVLTGLAFAAPIAAWSIGRKHESAMAVLHRVVVMPMFMFSGAFFPVQNLPNVLETVVKVTPLWHGVELCRGFTLHDLDPVMTPLHASYLLVLAGIGLVLGPREFGKVLES